MTGKKRCKVSQRGDSTSRFWVPRTFVVFLAVIIVLVLVGVADVRSQHVEQDSLFSGFFKFIFHTFQPREIGDDITGYDTATIMAAPTITSISLNATSHNNVTTDNLTAYVSTSDGDADPVKVTYAWYINGSIPWQVLNMPFEKVNNTDVNNTQDYAGGSAGNDGPGTGIVWCSDCGHDGKGAYFYDAADDYINLSRSLSGAWTITMWINAT